MVSLCLISCEQDAKLVASLPLESVVRVTGTVQQRPAGQANKARHQFILPCSDVNKDWTHKDQDKDKDQSHKDKDKDQTCKDKDWTHKDQDKDLTYKDSKQKTVSLNVFKKH